MQHSAAGKDIHSELRRLLPARLPEFLARQRWFGGKSRHIASVEIADIIPMRCGSFEPLLLVIHVNYVQGGAEAYAVPVLCGYKPDLAKRDDSSSLEVYDAQSGYALALGDAFQAEEFLFALLDSIRSKAVYHGERGELRGVPSAESSRLYSGSTADLKPRRLTGEQSNTSVIYGDRLILKFFRRIAEGINLDLEIGAFLTERAHFPHVPQLAGHLEYRPGDGNQVTQAILQALVPNQGDAWRHTLKTLSGYYGELLTRKNEVLALSASGGDVLGRANIPEFVRPFIEPYSSIAALLGLRTAQLHLALASEANDPAFAPEPFTMEFQKQWWDSVERLTQTTLRALRERTPELPERLRGKAELIASQEEQLTERFHFLLQAPIHAMRTRIHGDYHLGQVLYTGSDVVIIDFEGEPARPLSERRAKRSALQDVAGMMRSFHYAAFAPLQGTLENLPAHTDDLDWLSPWAEAWSTLVRDRFLTEYFKASGDAAYLPPSRDQRKSLLDVLLLEKAIYELGYELNNRPAWLAIPLEGIARLLSS